MGEQPPIQPDLTVVTPPLPGKVRVGDPFELAAKFSQILTPFKVNWVNVNSKKKSVYSISDSTTHHRALVTVDNRWSKVTLNQVEIDDEGEWSCEVYNSANVLLAKTLPTPLSVLVPRNYRKPRFLENLKAILTEEGLVSFECKVCGFPTPILRWFKDGVELKPGDVYQLSGANSLGTYTCLAHNCMGDAESSTQLTLDDIQHQLSDEERRSISEISSSGGNRRPPKFIKGLKSVEAKIMDKLVMEVQTSDAGAVVTWFREGEEVRASSEISIEQTGPLHRLSISSLALSHEGEWKATASNEYGHSVTSARVKLLIPPHYKKPRFLESLRAILSPEGTVNLECKVIGVPVPTLKWFKDGVELKAGDIHRIISGKDGTCCLGTYTCEATNCMGEVASSAALLGFEGELHYYWVFCQQF